MIFSGVGTSITILSTGSLPVLVAVALAVMWWLDDELGDEVVGRVEQPHAPDACRRGDSSEQLA
ncbi:MAG: hypothetical protein ACXWA3_18210 [Acidimicrobiales bacterium]